MLDPISCGRLPRRLRWFHAAIFLLAIVLCLGPSPARAGDLLATLRRNAPGANPRVLQLAARALRCVRRQTEVDTLGVIDYSLPSTKRRLWVFDLRHQRLLWREWVAHGRNSGGRLAEHFSNRPGSLMSSLGTFVSDGTYTGHNGLSLRLKGLDGRFNDAAERRAIVIHGAAYVSRAFARATGRMGRSWGCPAVRRKVARKLIETLHRHAVLFAYYPDPHWLHGAPTLNGCDGVAAELNARTAPAPPRSAAARG